MLSNGTTYRRDVGKFVSSVEKVVHDVCMSPTSTCECGEIRPLRMEERGRERERAQDSRKGERECWGWGE